MSAAIFAVRSLGSLYSDGGNNRSEGNVVLLGDTSVGSRANWFWLSGAVTGSGSFPKVGKGFFAWRKRERGNSAK